MKHFPSNSHGSLLAMSPVSPEPNKMPFLGFGSKDNNLTASLLLASSALNKGGQGKLISVMAIFTALVSA